MPDLRPKPARAAWIAAAAALALTGCKGSQSALDPAGRGAESIADLFWWMAGGAAVVWLVVIGLAVFSLHKRGHAAALIIGGGAVFPTVVLAILLSFGLAALPDLLEPAPEGSVRIVVTGEQWWWRVRYLPPAGEGREGLEDRAPSDRLMGGVELANEIRLPVGERVQFYLDSPDVIHSFWVPSLGGKMDMIPGRWNRLALEPTRTGVFRGACAEYCGTSHALMNFYVVVHEREDFDRWLAHQARPARPPGRPLARSGEALFLANGCGACHTVRGTPARGRVGPDLTHVGSRVSLGAGILPNEPDDFLRWVARTDRIKPEVHMPAFGMLPPEDLRALAAYLEGLE